MADSTKSNPQHYVEIRDSRGVVIGDNNVVRQYFLSEHYRPLADHFISFDELIAERTSGFVGRAFLDARLAAFLDQHDRGYFILEGEPGIGKTAWAAHVVQEWRTLHHFNVVTLGVIHPDQCLKNLCSQLIVRYHLDQLYLPPDIGKDGIYLNKLLHQASQRLDGRRVLIVIDALDEVEMPTEGRGANVLYLPSALPIGVYFVLTKRPQPILLETAPTTVLETFSLQADSPENMADLRSYLDPSRFVKELIKLSKGNFMYSTYLLSDIVEEQQDVSGLGQLPHGLQGYYERFWHEIEKTKGEGREDWSKFYKPVIGLLAAAREPVTVEWISQILKLDPEEVEDFALARWRKFLTAYNIPRRRGIGHQIYHHSFREFLAGKLGDGMKKYHQMIAHHYSVVCANDPKLLLQIDAGYGSDHILYHYDIAVSQVSVPKIAIDKLTDYEHKYLVYHLAQANMWNHLEKLLGHIRDMTH